LEAAEAGLLASAHDCSDGGLAVALAECCFSSLNRAGIGADVALPENLALSTESVLFSESPSRIVLSFPESSLAAVEEFASRAGCPFAVIGKVGDASLRIRFGSVEAISAKVSELESAWRGSLARKLEAEVMAAGME
jgi:phosphoribosylformylglycinamidine synthase